MPARPAPTAGDLPRARTLAVWLGRWYVALAVSAVLAALILLPGLDTPGLWEPQERMVADQKAPRAEIQEQRDKADAEAEAAKVQARIEKLNAAAAAGSGSAVPADASGFPITVPGSGVQSPVSLGSGSSAPAAGSGSSSPSPAPAAPEPPPPPPPPTPPAAPPSAGVAPAAGVPSTAGVAGTAPSSGAKPKPVTGPAATAAAKDADTENCPRLAPKDATARSLTGRAAAWGRDTFGDSDAGRRLPLALLGLLTALAIAGTTMRLAGGRAGIIACAVGLSFPLLVLQSRQLTSEIGTACGASLIIYGAVALGSARVTALGILDAIVAAAALAAGLYLGFAGGGALLGMIAPLGALALAGPWRRSAPASDDAGPRAWLPTVVALVAGAAALVILGILIHQVYDLALPKLGATPPQRAIFGKAIVSSQCWSTAVGGTWRADDDSRMIFDSTWEQIAYGTYPWGVLAPIAIAALIGARDAGRRRLGVLALAWAGCAWIASEVFQRKVGATIFAGFPALAIAVGAWLDGVLAGPAPDDERSGSRGGLMLVGLFAILAMLDIGKDMHEFADKVSALLVGGEGLAYPAQAHLLLIPAKLWILILGVLVGIAIGLALFQVRTNRSGRNLGLGFAAAAIALTVVIAAFWSFAWQPRLAEHLSSKAMFDTYLDLRKPGDALVMMGDLGDAAHDYAPDAKPEIMNTREQVVAALGRTTPGRVFAIAPQGELCQLHREVGGKPYFVIDDRNTRDLLLSNKVDGTTDKNPLAVAIVHTEPKDIPIRPKANITFDNRIQLLGWDIPKSVGRGDKFTVVMYYRVLQAVGGSWKVLFHFDGPQALRFNGDHPPIDDRCPTSTWQPGDFIIDRHTVTAGAGAFQPGSYDVWTGFFTGSNPNFKNMPISQGPGDMRDPAGTDRIKITTIVLE